MKQNRCDAKSLKASTTPGLEARHLLYPLILMGGLSTILSTWLETPKVISGDNSMVHLHCFLYIRAHSPSLPNIHYLKKKIVLYILSFCFMFFVCFTLIFAFFSFEQGGNSDSVASCLQKKKKKVFNLNSIYLEINYKIIKL